MGPIPPYSTRFGSSSSSCSSADCGLCMDRLLSRDLMGPWQLMQHPRRCHIVVAATSSLQTSFSVHGDSVALM